VRYGVLARPRHSPQSAPPSAAPVSGHERTAARDCAACRDEVSGARERTRARFQRSATQAPYAQPARYQRIKAAGINPGEAKIRRLAEGRILGQIVLLPEA